MRLTRQWIAAALILGFAAGAAHGAGMLIPSDESIPPLAVKFLRVDATVENQVATTHVTQEFLNSTSRDLECTYIFPLPKGAAIRDFAMYIGGKRMKGELLEKGKATQIYEEIVRRAKDPGLLEYMDGGVLRLKIFPVPARGTQKVEIEYSEMLPMDEGLAEYCFPLKLGEKASKTLEDFTVSVRIKSATPIKTVYSPTHEVGISRPNDHEAVAGMEMKAARLDRDFQLFYTVSEKDFGLSLMTYRPDPDKPGMFLMMIAPKSEVAAKERAARDVVLILDTSGSMSGSKIEQAKKSVKFALEKLEGDDRFAIIQFSTMATTYAEGWTDATAENVKKATAWVGEFAASGGTNYSETLAKLFALKFDDSRPATVFFVTDGRPTVDVTDPDALLKTVKENNQRNLRVFTFGVGDDVNTKLLDRISGDTGGLTEYVRGDEAVDAKITRLAAKMTHPVLTNLTLDIKNIKIVDMFPKELPDLFRGGQVVVAGSYTGDGDAAIRLKGSVGKKTEEFVYEAAFPKKGTDRSFIGSVYANRKVGYLLDQIRLHGENPELKEEVIRLSTAYGIETPYTSFLVLESEQQYQQYGIKRDNTVTATKSLPSGVATGPAPTPGAQPAADPGKNMTERTRAVNDALSYMGKGKAGSGAMGVGGSGGYGDGRGGAGGGRLSGGTSASPAAPTVTPPASAKAEPKAGPARPSDPSLEKAAAEGADESAARVQGEKFYGVTADDLKREESGKKAVDIATNIAKLRQSEGDRDAKNQKRVENKAGHQMVNFRGVWVDEKFAGTEKLTKIKWGSEAFFRLLREKPELKDVFSLGQQVVVVIARGQAVAVDTEEGVEKFTDDEVKALLTDVPEKAAEKK
jgi:Ca-activated chloride channel homolog